MVLHCNRLHLQAEVKDAALFIMSHEVDMQNPVCWLHRRTATGPFQVRS